MPTDDLPLTETLDHFHWSFLTLSYSVAAIISVTTFLIIQLWFGYLLWARYYSFSLSMVTSSSYAYIYMISRVVPLIGVIILCFGGFSYLHLAYTPTPVKTWMADELSLLATPPPTISLRNRTYHVQTALPLFPIIHVHLIFSKNKQSFSLTTKIPYVISGGLESSLLAYGFQYKPEQSAIIIRCQPEEFRWRLWQLLRFSETTANN